MAMWAASFPNAAPAGFLCRHELPHRWLRIHSLPDAQRYAQNDAERRELLRRQNTAAQCVLGSSASCLLFAARFGPDAHWIDTALPQVNMAELTHTHSGHADGDPIQFFVAPLAWQTHAFDTLLTAVANNDTGQLLIFNPNTHTAFAPYDGGADLFTATPDAVPALKAELAAWRSPHPTGL